MIIKSHIRAGYRAAADYLKEQGKNEHIRLVEISDPDATNLDQAFHNMWVIASATKARKPLHHISINPFKDERLTDHQVQLIVERCEHVYGYKSGDHQRVIVEHIKEGRQHFHVIWNRVSLRTGKTVWPGHHWLKSKQVCREVEVELKLKRPVSHKTKSLQLSTPLFMPIFLGQTARPTKYYAEILGEHQEINSHKKKKSSKGEGAGDGATTGNTIHKTTKNKTTAPVKNGESEIGKGNGPERRKKKMWVAVERRNQKPGR